MKWGMEDDMFDPKAVEEGRRLRDRCQNETGPNGENRYCGQCGKAVGITSIEGSCCPFCGCTKRR